MFRARRFVRRMNRAMASVPPALTMANEYAATGNYAAASLAYEDLAIGAENRDGPRAPWFLLQAGRMRLLGGQNQVAMVHFERGLNMLASRGQWQQFHTAGERIVQELTSRGHADLAEKINALLKTTSPAGFPPVSQSGTQKSSKVLPTNCPTCGGPLRVNEVDWLDDITAECPYCGNSVRVDG
jgi:hypothetical protein